METCDGKRQRRFHQAFSNNMSEKTSPKITACKATDNWTCITFQPDLAKFDMQELEEDVVALMRKRVYDVAGVLGKGCKVSLNGYGIVRAADPGFPKTMGCRWSPACTSNRPYVWNIY